MTDSVSENGCSTTISTGKFFLTKNSSVMLCKALEINEISWSAFAGMRKCSQKPNFNTKNINKIELNFDFNIILGFQFLLNLKDSSTMFN